MHDDTDSLDVQIPSKRLRDSQRFELDELDIDLFIATPGNAVPSSRYTPTRNTGHGIADADINDFVSKYISLSAGTMLVVGQSLPQK